MKTIEFHCYDCSGLPSTGDPFYNLYELVNQDVAEPAKCIRLYVFAHSQKDAIKLALKSEFFKKDDRKNKYNLEAKEIGHGKDITIILPKHITPKTLTLD